MLEILRKAFTEEDFRDFEMFLGFCMFELLLGQVGT